MIEIIYRVKIVKSDTYKQVRVHSTNGRYEVVEGVHSSYCDQFNRPYTDYDFNTSRMFDNAFDADDYARKRFFELQKEGVNDER